jgi:asparagine synthase (glutamine-hydrolysing)
MCGIVGAISSQPETIIGDKIIEALSSMKTRGPDFSGLQKFIDQDAKILFGHNRLSIIDISSNSNQPMMSRCGRFWIVFNGEIYNYKEIAKELISSGVNVDDQSDTHVLLEAWVHFKEDLLPRLKGMFAFAIYDSKIQSVTLCRDAFGIKPIFLYSKNNEFYFASETTALLKLIDEKINISPQQAYDYLVYGDYDQTEQSFFKNISSLKPGHFARVYIVSPEEIAFTQWWKPSIGVNARIGFDQAANQLKELFLDSVRLHLRSDVPLGAALSGGIDSSAIVCAMRVIEPKMEIHTFSYIANQDGVSEERWVDLVNEYVKATPHKIKFDDEEIFTDVENLIKCQGEPFGGTSVYAQNRIFKEVHESGLRVLLTGQGADELLAGYDGYPQYYMRSLLDSKSYLKLINFSFNWGRWPGRSLKRSSLLFGDAAFPSKIKPFIRGILGQKKIPSYINNEFIVSNAIKIGLHSDLGWSIDGHQRRLVEKLRSVQLGCGLAEQLRDGDRDSMHWSVESRVPFLTTDIAEFLLSLPENYLLSDNGDTKHIFKAAMRGIVPDAILDRKDKIGFKTPEVSILLNNISTVQYEIMVSLPKSIIMKDEVIVLLDKFKSGQYALAPKIWRLYNFSVWCRVFEMNE